MQQMQLPQDMWYLDLYAFKHLTNNKNLFIKSLQPKCFDFTTVGGQILWAESIGTIAILLADGSSFKLCNVVYAPDCNSNLISFSQLCDSNITYVNNSEVMILIQADQAITYARCDQNFFILDLATPNKVMQIIRHRRPTHLVSKNKKVRVWYWRFGHASNAKIVKVLKLWRGIKNFNNAYDPIKKYSNLE